MVVKEIMNRDSKTAEEKQGESDSEGVNQLEQNKIYFHQRVELSNRSMNGRSVREGM